MKRVLALVGALTCVGFASIASAQSWGVSEDTPWRFRSSDQTAVLQNNVNMIELQKSGYYDLLKSGGAAGAAAGGGGGLFGTTTSSTQNFFQVIQQTTNNCSATAVGATLSCGSGNQSVSGTNLTSTGNTTHSTTTVTDNVVDNVSNSGSGTQNVTAAPK